MRYPPSTYPGWCEKNGHDWCWSDTTKFWENYYIWTPHPYSFECPGICRTCLAETLAVWSYAEDQQRRAAAKKLTEYERLKARKP